MVPVPYSTVKAIELHKLQMAIAKGQPRISLQVYLPYGTVPNSAYLPSSLPYVTVPVLSYVQTVLYGTVRYGTEQDRYRTVRYCTVRYGNVYSEVQYRTVP